MKTRNLIGVALTGFAAMLVMQKMRSSPIDLRGQVVLITGSSRGLGFILAREFARLGCDIIICARDADELEQARAELAKIRSGVLAMPCDVSDEQQVMQLVDTATARFGRIDILINNAGIVQTAPLNAVTVQDFVDSHAVMFWGVLYPTLAVLPQMRTRRSGRIVNITSIGGKVSIPHLLPYSSAKFAATGLSAGLRAELHREGITVTTIAPGLMRTGSYLKALFKGKEAEEFTWFALADNLPILSMDAERAAHQIMEAIRRGEAERVLTVPATLLARLYGLFPGLTTDLLGFTSWLLPTAEQTDPESVTGEVARQGMSTTHRKIIDALTIMGRRAAEQFQQ
jgi:NAD(P)-dependent dehydrogenase (short-subunit alcohol dehydrogenase family)